MKKNFLAKFYESHVLANLLFVLILIIGFVTYKSMPREQDPTVNFNWIAISATYPGASSNDVEKLVTDKLEEAIKKVSDIKFVSSKSKENFCSILIRFNQIDDATFDKRINDLRREIQNKYSELPKEVDHPSILEITSSNAFPSASIVIIGKANDELLRKQAKNIKDDLDRLKGIDRIDAYGLQNPELQVLFDPAKLAEHKINPDDLANTLLLNFKDLSAGTADLGKNKWLVRWIGKSFDPKYISNLQVITKQEEFLLKEVAKVQRGRETEKKLVSYNDQNAILLSIMKQSKTNTLKLVENLKQYIKNKNNLIKNTGIQIKLLDDQTEVTKNALKIMQTNALFGLILVLFTTWLFLGIKIALLVSIGIPFVLAGTFCVLNFFGETLNVSVLLGVVITLGMLVDDAVVVVEAIYYRLSRGIKKMPAIMGALKEVFSPVTTSVLTTISAFIPLMLLPGILGKFMMVIPMVVTIALSISLIEAYWMLPAHIGYVKLNFKNPTKIQKLRINITRILRIKYTKLLIKALRHPKATFLSLLSLIILAIIIVFSGLIKIDFFASDPLRLFYVNVEMPINTTLEKTLAKTKLIENKIRNHLKLDEIKSIASYAGFMFTKTSPNSGEQYGQVIVSLNPQKKGQRSVNKIINTMRADIKNTAGPKNISFLKLSSGPPSSKPINIKIRGNNYDELRKASAKIKDFLKNIDYVFDIKDDDTEGRKELQLIPNNDAIRRAGLNPQTIARTIRLLVNGEIISNIQHEGEKVDLRIKAKQINYSNIKDVLQHTITLKNGKNIRFSELVKAKTVPSLTTIKHYNFRRTITIGGDINKKKTNTMAINKIIKNKWNTISQKYPNINLDFSGELDDIQESINAMPFLFLIGIGIIYLILGTQFSSYFQPLLILITVPLAFAGVIFGLLISQNPLSLYTLYGIVALSGITVNASIVLISAANERLKNGMSLEFATVFAAKRRFIPIIITSLTTISGLLSLAIGLGGKSLLWGPVATSIVWGLLFSTTLTLFVIPLLYRLSMNKFNKRKKLK